MELGSTTSHSNPAKCPSPSVVGDCQVTHVVARMYPGILWGAIGKSPHVVARIHSHVRSDIHKVSLDVAPKSRDLRRVTGEYVPTLTEVWDFLVGFKEATEASFEHLTSDVAVLKSDMVVVKSDMVVVKSDIVTVKSDMAAVKSDLKQLQLDVQRMDRRLVRMDDRLADLEVRPK